MDNKVGDKLFSAQKLNVIVKQIKGVRNAVREHGVVLTSAQRKRVLRPRKGADAAMQRVYALSTKYGVAVPNVPLEGMQHDLALALQMQSLEDELIPALTLVQDTGAQADSEAWEAFLAYYGVLASMAARFPELATELAPTVAFMAIGPRAAANSPSQHPSSPPPAGTNGSAVPHASADDPAA